MQTINLPLPLTVDGQTFEALSLREPTCEEVLKAEEANEKAGGGIAGFRAYQVALLGTVTGKPRDALLKLPITVHEEAADLLTAWRQEGTEACSPVPGETLEIILDPPVEVNGRMEHSIALCEPELAHVLFAEKSMQGGTGNPAMLRFARGLVVQNAGIPLPIASALPISTLNRAAAFLAGFTKAGRRAGES